MQDTDVKGRVMAAAELMFVSVLTFLENAIKKKKIISLRWKKLNNKIKKTTGCKLK